MKEIILVVDDSKEKQAKAKEVLEQDYTVWLAASGKEALELMEKQLPDLVLLDVFLLGMSGFETISNMRKIPDADKIPVFFLTSDSDLELEVEGLELGAIDYIRKPYVPQIMLSRIKGQLELSRYQNHLEDVIAEKEEQLERVEDALVASLSDLLEVRDGGTGGHAKRVAKYFSILLDAMVSQGAYLEYLTPEKRKRMKRGVVLHDIGKVGIHDNTLLKEDKLSWQEMEYMRQHTTYGGKTLQNAIEALGEDSFLNDAKELAFYHHEKWDGTGYPKGLKGEEIPVGARIVAIADVYDALTSKRSYKEPFSHEKAMEILAEGRGSSFDPKVFDAFVTVEQQFDQYRREEQACN